MFEFYIILYLGVSFSTAMFFWFEPMGTSPLELFYTFIAGAVIGLIWPLWWGSVVFFVIKDWLRRRN
jgi:hypothetical protein